MAFLIVRALSKSYAVGDRRLPVLRELDLTVDEGEMVAVVGASGIGKSTLLHCVGGLDALDGGSVTIAGTELSSAGDDARVAFRNRHIGFVFQFHHLLPEFSAVENVAMPLRIARASRGEAHRRAEALLREVGLGERMTHRPGMLSGGEQQRAAVARALVMQPALLLADEPTGDLDEQTGRDLHALLRRLHATRRLTSLIATHNLQIRCGQRPRAPARRRPSAAGLDSLSGPDPTRLQRGANQTETPPRIWWVDAPSAPHARATPAAPRALTERTRARRTAGRRSLPTA